MKRRYTLKGCTRLLVSFREPLKRLGRRVWQESGDDNVTGLAAQMSFFFALALFPFFILLAALAGTLPATGLWTHILQWVTLYLPESSQTLVFNTVASLTRGREGFLSIGVLSAAWAASGGVLTLMSSLNAAYEAKETRSLWKRAGLAILMLFVLCFLFLGSFGVLTVGHLFAIWIATHVGSRFPLLEVWRVGHWLVSVLLLILGMAVVYRVLPNKKQGWWSTAPGIALAVIIWIPGTLAFNFYVRHIGSYNRIYGELASFMILLVWIYIISLIVLLGAEINSEFIKMRASAAGQAAEPAPAQKYR